MQLGFDQVGFTRAPGDPQDAINLAAYIEDGRHGEMAWLAREPEKRADPARLWPEARTVICVAMNYGPASDPLATIGEQDTGTISVYARGRDYHKVMKKGLKQLGRWIAGAYGCEVKVFVDTAPIMEKPLAQRAGLGWIGKHTNLVSRRFGSWLFLGEILTSLDLSPDPGAIDHCGTCDACMRACPTQALDEPYQIETRRCLSYLTIEHAGEIEPQLARQAGNRIYGCDDCLAVCPWNKFARPTQHTSFFERPDLQRPGLLQLSRLTDDAFRARFSGTAIKRIGYKRMVRNAEIARSNASSAHIR
ncbi:MAG: tRNA epoxyqueuosine(34) reductase QueG [Hyphomicrobiales bacterium]|nr:tRNA epoxyqueuosine(34) reductase QueG [Hyphomicrobiales bacterium]